MLEDIEQVLETKNDTSFLDLIKNQKYINIIKDNPWQIIPSIIKHIEENTLKENPKFYRILLEGLSIVTEEIEPEDTVLILVQEIGDTKCDSTFLHLLKPLQIATIKLLPRNRISYFTWSLNAIQTYLNNLPAPENLNLEGNTRLLMDADKTVARISTLYYDMLPFYNEIISITLHLNYDYKLLLIRSILQLFGHPLFYLDMDVEGKPKSRARIVAENLINNIITLSPDVYDFLKEGYLSEHDVEIKEISLSTFYYLHLSESIGLEKSPKVYNPIYIFQSTLRFVVPLLSIEHQFVIEKGLKLMSALLKMTRSCILSYQLLDSDIHSKFCKTISSIIIYNAIEIYRKEGLKIFHNYLHNFDSHGRYLLIYNIVKNIDNVSLSAYLITQYKQMLTEQLDKKAEIDNYFQGSKLRTLFSIFCYLPNGVETDLIKNADKIIASLNLLRYLVLRDRANNTGTWNHIKLLQETFLVPLKEALILSRAHYDLKLKDIIDGNAHGDKFNDDKLSVTIGEKYLPGLTQDEKVNVINSSLTAFDVIESLLSRLNECIDYNISIIE